MVIILSPILILCIGESCIVKTYELRMNNQLKAFNQVYSKWLLLLIITIFCFSFNELLINRRQNFTKLSVLLKLLRYFYNDFFGILMKNENLQCIYVYHHMQEELKQAKFEATSKIKELTEVKPETLISLNVIICFKYYILSLIFVVLYRLSFLLKQSAVCCI